MRKIESEGKNVEGAIKKGLKDLELSRDEVEIKILDEGAAGIFGLGGKPARVEISEKVSSLQAERYTSEEKRDKGEAIRESGH